MGDRFYSQQLNRFGDCPGAPFTSKRKKRMAWTDEKKAEVIEAYEAKSPTPETSMDIVTDLADEFEESVNGVRMILSKAGVYVKKAPAAKSSGGSSGGSTGGGRVSKQAAQDALVAAIEEAGQEVDDEIVSKLTGKAAQYFTTVLTSIKG